MPKFKRIKVEDEVTVSEKSPDTAEPTEKTPTGTGATEKDESGAVPAEQSPGEDVSFSQRAKWDWTELLYSSDEVVQFAEAMTKTARPRHGDNPAVADEQDWKRTTVRFGDFASPEDKVGTLESTSIGALHKTIEGITVVDGKVFIARPINADSISLADTDPIVLPKIIQSDNPSLADSLDAKRVLNQSADNEPSPDDAAFTYGHGGYGELSYGAPAP